MFLVEMDVSFEFSQLTNVKYYKMFCFLLE
uniref:Uncharacterized protein n=1 Tax=Lepeophtheirus salmonis TaxID=72036 RepID=A0A0K2U3Y8_LEPSM